MALASAIAVGAATAITCGGYGVLVRLMLRLPPRSRLDELWLGWAFLVALLQVVHLFLPITAAVTLSLFAAGMVAFFSLTPIRPRRWTFAAVAIFGACLAGAVWLASRAMETPTNFDSGLYHFTSIRWTETFPVVPGLGNLHGRLAFNQSFFLFVAALNAQPLFGHGYSVANSFLLLLLTATLFRALVRRRDGGDTLPERFVAALLLPVVVYLAISSNGIASPSPDLASTVLQLFLFFRLTARFTGNGPNHGAIDATVLAALAAILISVKLSNVAYASVVIIIAMAMAWRDTRSAASVVRAVVAPCLFVISFWLFRGFVLSGAPLFPSAVIWIPVDWAVPRAKIVDEANWIYSWARQPGVHWRTVLSDWSWFQPWVGRMLRAKIEVSYPLFSGAAMAVAALGISHRHPRNLARPAVLGLPVIASLCLWFVTAPDVRFAHAAFLLAPVIGGVFLMEVAMRMRRDMARRLMPVIFAVATVHIGYYLWLNHAEFTRISTSGWQPLPRPALARTLTAGGVTVGVPEGGQCWNAALLCAPEVDHRLAFRTPDRLGDGFRMVKDQNP